MNYTSFSYLIYLPQNSAERDYNAAARLKNVALLLLLGDQRAREARWAYDSCAAGLRVSGGGSSAARVQVAHCVRISASCPGIAVVSADGGGGAEAVMCDWEGKL